RKGWSTVATPRVDWLVALWGSSAGDVWAAGGDSLLHGDGTTWTATRAPAGATLRAIWGASPSSVWAAGADLVLHWDGQDWSRAWSNGEDGRLLRSGWSSGPE